ncbi:TOMM precursor leader peptide-binding protein [Polyangium jinanense]|uniref:TOMM leader peptide-binding protein n=1 Tax=Polyangium jinanense TaxID=2829994 RepID=A0A9X3X2C3_9BACT|nr:TOMM precursor leader peptide-binding protein [Polyangium jinanense]MDC3956070.1 TOMM precursor leader peptide-binding protein [Polyangium jinanense]MDC3982899.1 TOMM precursor leader peptide-binding protein [Polyangium jinanense]
MLPYLDGTHETSEIFMELDRKGLSAATARALLERLERTAILEHALDAPLDEDEQDDPAIRRQRSFFSRFADDGGRALQKRLQSSRVGLVCDAGLGPVVLRQLTQSGIEDVLVFPVRPELARCELSVASTRLSSVARVAVHSLDRRRIWPDGLAAPLPDLFIVALAADDPELLESMEEFSFERNVPWLLLQVDSSREASIGPLFVPRESACYSCMEGRVLSNLRFPGEYLAFREHLRRQQHASAEIGGLAAFYELTAGIAVMEVVKFITGYSAPQLVGRLLTVDTTTWSSEFHDVLRLPQCRCRLGQETFFPWKEPCYVSRQGR